MEELLVICRNCGRVERYKINYMTPKRKEYHDCCNCGNRTRNYKDRRKAINNQIKLGNEEAILLINEDKYNKKVFGVHKGFDYKKIKGDI